MLLAYFTPEVVLPVATAVGAIFGFVMAVGRTPLRIAARGARAAVRGLKSILPKRNP